MVIADDHVFDEPAAVDDEADLPGRLFRYVHELSCEIGRDDHGGWEPFLVETGETPFYEVVEPLGISVKLYGIPLSVTPS